MKPFATLLLLAMLPGSQLFAFNGNGSGGGTTVEQAKAQIQLTLNSDQLKNAMLNYLETLQVDQITAKSQDENTIKTILKNVTQNKELQKDISASRYVAAENCLDSNNQESSASTLIGTLGADICFNIPRLAAEIAGQTSEDLIIKLAALAFHEHIHHFQNQMTDIQKNEYDAYLISAYVELTARYVQVPMLKWAPEESKSMSVCSRNLRLVNIIEEEVGKQCYDITLADLAGIKELSLQSGVGISKPIALKAGDLLGLTGLERLDAGGAVIHDLSAEILKGLSSLKFLTLSYTQIKTVQPDAFKYLSSIETILLGNNPIEALHPDTFKNLPTLQVVSLKGAQLKTLPLDIFKNAPGLTGINLSEMPLTQLSRELFSSNKKLGWLGLGSLKSVPSIDKDLFQGLPELWRIYMNGSPWELNPEMFRGLSKLVDIYAASCGLKTVPLNDTLGLTSLKNVNMNYNNISDKEKARARKEFPQVEFQF